MEDDSVDLDDPFVQSLIEQMRGSSRRNKRSESSVESTPAVRSTRHADGEASDVDHRRRKKGDVRESAEKPRRAKRSDRIELHPRRNLNANMSSWDRKSNGQKICASCGSFGKIMGRGLCPRCYRREYWRARYGRRGSEFFPDASSDSGR